MNPVRAAFLLVFFASGFAALLYQTIWQRILTLFGGSDIHSVTIIVAAFMAGLGFGSLVGGYVADRLPPGRRVVAFALCELAIAVFALASATIYYDWLYVRLGDLHLSPLAMGVVVFLVTLWPTFFMGMSLPIAAKALTDEARQPARWIPLLYGWNTVGAATGSLVAVAVLFRTMDFESALRIGAALNGLCAVTCLAMSPLLPGGHRTLPASHADDAPPAGAGVFAIGTWMAIYALSGFVALSLEIVWFRILGVILKSNSLTFGVLLATYLGGVGLGALVANTGLVRRWRPAPAFFLSQLAIPVYAALILPAFLLGAEHLSWARPLWMYMAGTEPLALSDIRDNLTLFLLVYLFVPAIIIGPPTLLMGLSFGLLHRAVQTDLDKLGRRVGWLQTANIVGAMFGTILTGFVLLDRFGSTGMLRLLVLLSVGLAFGYARTSARSSTRRPIARAAALVVVAAAVVAPPTSDRFWSRLHGSSTETIHGEDGTGVALIKVASSADGQPRAQLFAGGLAQSMVPYGGIHMELAALPLMLHPNPERIAIIGLGSGNTLFGAGGRRETRVIDSIEIIAPEFTALQELNRRITYEPLRHLLGDPRVRHTFTDGRAFLRRSSERYDIIEADALRPRSAYSGNLYSVEYFELLRSRLRPGGLAVTWAPTERVRDTVRVVFGHVQIFGSTRTHGSIAIGSDSVIPLDRAVINARMHDPETRAYYARAGIEVDRLLGPLLDATSSSNAAGNDRGALWDVNRDLFPRDEFALPYQGGAAAGRDR